MLGSDNLFRLERWLDDDGERDAGIIPAMNESLEAIFNLREYQAWLQEATPYPRRFQIPNRFGTTLSPKARRILDRFGLIDGQFLEVKVDLHGNRIHLTDGGWVPSSFRVYPYSDESQLLCKYIEANGLATNVTLLIDPACGCGHHGLALKSIPIRTYLDINLRALAFCRINSILSRTEQMLSGLNDIRQGFPLVFQQVHCEKALVVVNMPFSIHPKSDALPISLAQDGGDRGVDLTFSAITAVRDLAASAPGIAGLRMVLLFYSLGTKGGDGWKWEVETKARELIPSSTIRVTTLMSEQMWRVNGVKSEKCPMPISQMRTKALCTHTYSEAQRSEAESGYIKLQAVFEKAGYTHLGYGILDVEVRQ